MCLESKLGLRDDSGYLLGRRFSQLRRPCKTALHDCLEIAFWQVAYPALKINSPVGLILYEAEGCKNIFNLTRKFPCTDFAEPNPVGRSVKIHSMREVLLLG